MLFRGKEDVFPRWRLGQMFSLEKSLDNCHKIQRFVLPRMDLEILPPPIGKPFSVMDQRFVYKRHFPTEENACFLRMTSFFLTLISRQVFSFLHLFPVSLWLKELGPLSLRLRNLSLLGTSFLSLWPLIEALNFYSDPSTETISLTHLLCISPNSHKIKPLYLQNPSSLQRWWQLICNLFFFLYLHIFGHKRLLFFRWMCLNWMSVLSVPALFLFSNSLAISFSYYFPIPFDGFVQL